MVKVAILGAGFMGATHGTAYEEIENAFVAAICDKNEVLGKELAEKYHCAYFGDFEEMVRECDFEVADICLPTYLHETYATLAVRHKKHLFVEKPVTLSVESLDRMIGGVRAAGVRMMVGQVVRFWPEYKNAKKIYDSQELGSLKSVYAARLAQHPAWSEWYCHAENSGGGLMDLHLHDIDFLCYLLGKAKSVYSVGQKNSYGCWNHVNTILTFENGISAMVEGIMEMTKGYPFTMQLRLVGSEKTYEYIMKAGANLEDVASSKRDSKLYERGKVITLPLDERDAYGIELKHFIECIDEKRESEIINLDQIRSVLCTIEAIKRSLETGNKAEVVY